MVDMFPTRMYINFFNPPIINNNTLIIIEVWHGKILKEDDIFRYDDIYGRDLK